MTTKKTCLRGSGKPTLKAVAAGDSGLAEESTVAVTVQVPVWVARAALSECGASGAKLAGRLRKVLELHYQINGPVTLGRGGK